MNEVNFTLKEVVEDWVRYKKESDKWLGKLKDKPRFPIVSFDHIDGKTNWKPIETSDGYIIYGASYETGTGFFGESVVSLNGDYKRLENPQLDIMTNRVPNGAIMVWMNHSSDSSHGTLYWAEKAEKKEE